MIRIVYGSNVYLWHIILTMSVGFVGQFTEWTGDSNKETFKNFKPRPWRVQKWGHTYRKTATCKSCQSSGILHWERRKYVDLWIHAEQKLGSLPLWSANFHASHHSLCIHMLSNLYFWTQKLKWVQPFPLWRRYHDLWISFPTLCNN